MEEEEATSLHQDQVHQSQHLIESKTTLDSSEQRLLTRRKAASSPHDDDDDGEKLKPLPQPHRLINTTWGLHEMKDACEISRSALDDLMKSLDSFPNGDHVLQVANVENLFLVHTDIKQTHAIEYCSYADPNGHACGTGSKDVMLDLGEAILTYS